MVLFSSISYFSYSKRCTIDPVVALRHNAENCHSSCPSTEGPSCYVKRHKSCDWGHKFQVHDEWAGKFEVGRLKEMMDFLSFFKKERQNPPDMACPIVLSRNTARKISPNNHHCLCRMSGNRLPTQRVFKHASPLCDILSALDFQLVDFVSEHFHDLHWFCKQCEDQFQEKG